MNLFNKKKFKTIIIAFCLIMVLNTTALAAQGDYYDSTVYKKYTNSQLANFGVKREIIKAYQDKHVIYVDTGSGILNYLSANRVLAQQLASGRSVQQALAAMISDPSIKAPSDFKDSDYLTGEQLKVDSITAINEKTIRLIFNTEIKSMTAITSNFLLFDKYNDSIIPTKVILETDNKAINLIFNDSLNAENAPYSLEIKEDLKSKLDKSVNTKINEVVLPLEVPGISLVTALDKNSIMINFDREIFDTTITPDILESHIMVTDLSDSTKTYTVNLDTEVISGKVKVKLNEELMPSHNYKIIFTKFAVKDYFGTRNGTTEYLFEGPVTGEKRIEK